MHDQSKSPPRIGASSPDASSPRALHERDVPKRIVGRVGSHKLVFLGLNEVWAFETRDRLVVVHSRYGAFDVDFVLSHFEVELTPCFCRVHRSWLVAVAKVRSLSRGGAEPCLVLGERLDDPKAQLIVPIAVARFAEVRRQLLRGSIGVRLPAEEAAGHAAGDDFGAR
jgi:DNA-binding LytR/AlgR family response regulator